MKENVIREKEYEFALNVIKLYKALKDEREFTLSRQLLRSGTSIGANIEEAQGATSKKDFLQKMSIAHKEARETNYWLRLLRDSKIGNAEIVSGLISNSAEIIPMLSSITKTTRKNLE